jgi:hypothetical protein
VITAVIGMFAQLGTAYPGFAETQTLPKGRWTGSNGWYAYHGIASLGLIYIAWSVGGLLGLVVVVVLSFIGAFVLAMLFRSWAQSMSLLSLPLTVLWYVIALGEDCVGSSCTRIIDRLAMSL